jgi:hypothetical protein
VTAGERKRMIAEAKQAIVDAVNEAATQVRLATLNEVAHIVMEVGKMREPDSPSGDIWEQCARTIDRRIEALVEQTRRRG